MGSALDFGVTPAATASGANQFTNLAVNNPTVATVNVTADTLVVDDGTTQTLLRNVNETADITASGAGGLDTGSATSATDYFVWLIYNPTTLAVDALISLSDSAPTLPAGYTQKALLSWFRYTGASEIKGFHQYNRRYYYDEWLLLASGNVGIGAWVSVDYSTGAIPTTISDIPIGTIAIGDNSFRGSITNDNTIPVDGVGNPQRNRYGAVFGAYGGFYYELPFRTANTLYWASNVAAAELYVSGCYLNKI